MRNRAEFINCIRKIAAGEMAIPIASLICGYSKERLRTASRDYKIYGESVFIHRNTGKSPKNKTSYHMTKKICAIYRNEFAGFNFLFFRDMLEEYYDIKLSYNTVYYILTKDGIKSPEARRVKRTEDYHRPRRRRACEGELLQIDGTPYQWFAWAGDTRYYCLHCSVDDATSKATAFYMCENECFYGYTELVRRTFFNYNGGHPNAVYSDAAAIFKTPEKDRYNTSVEEQLNGQSVHETQWQRMMRELNVDIIIAHSPQAKGRVERMNETLQGRLPWYFKHFGIKTLDQANAFLLKFVDIYNDKFSVPAESPIKVWHKTGMNPDYVLSKRISRKLWTGNRFSFEGYKWKILWNLKNVNKFELCINERGLQAYYNGNFYPVKIVDDYQGVDTQVLDAILQKHIYSDCKERCA